MAIGILTNGGDAPGLNAVIRAIVISGTRTHDREFIGIRNGWKGMMEENLFPLERRHIMGISKQGGTILGTSRTTPFDYGGAERVREIMDRHSMEALVVIGGDGTLSATKLLTDVGLPIVGVPKTVDNDIGATDYSFGFDTAVQIATDAMDRLRTTGDSHHRCMVAEMMGRDVGWIALHSGVAAGAHAILIPEHKLSIDEICGWVTHAFQRGRAPLVAVAEGFSLDTMTDVHSERGLDTFGRPRLGGIGELLAPLIQEKTGIETRATTLGHIQRGGTPSGFDRVLATRLGWGAMQMVLDKKWGFMVALRGTEIVDVSLESAVGSLKIVPKERYDEARALFG